MRMKDDRKGFTLAELLIVVAIIAVLVAISIPIFRSQLEKSREAADLANVRSAYAQVMTAANTEDQSSVKYGNGVYYLLVDLTQKEEGWTTAEASLSVGGVTPAESSKWIGSPQANGQCRVSYSAADGVKLTWSGSATITTLTDGVKNGSKFTADYLVHCGKQAYFTKDIVINGTTLSVRSYYAGKDSAFYQDALEFEKNPVPTGFTKSSFYNTDDKHDKVTTNGVKAFAYFDFDEQNNIKNYTLVTSDAVYYSPDGGKTWQLK